MMLLILALLSAPAHADPKFTDETQAGVVVTNGNSRTQTYNVASTTKYVFDANSFELKGNYLRGVNQGIVNALNWSIGLRYERKFSEQLSAFLGESVEGDQFAGILQRYNTDAGAKHFLFKTDKDFTWFVEAGYRYTSEHTTLGSTKGYQKARAYTEAEKYWAPGTSTKFWIEYIPNFTASQLWLLNTELSVNSALNEIFALKTAYGLRYNNTPPVPTAQKADSTLSTSLVAKF